MNSAMRAAVMLVGTGMLALVACGGDGDGGRAAGPSTTPEAEATANDFGCLSGKQLKKSITFKDSAGADVDGYETGTGATGVILSHQSDNNICSWVAGAEELASDGYRVIAVDSNGSEVEEIQGAAERLRGEGAGKIVLIGASKGGTASLVAASEVRPAVVAVVSVSGPGLYQDMDATAAVPKLTMPAYFIAAKGDGEFASDAQELAKLAKKSPGKKLELVDGAQHGNDLLNQQPSVWDEVKAFIAKHS
ncbi:alpha/beta hydrolase family protein [Streptomyces sp. NPDC092369]|uniref:alpha/beta hydrolase family protein n=1 Tax=Streptomyces sp. NPDC092369 TaxID=3366015 RepID=UPI0038013D45